MYGCTEFVASFYGKGTVLSWPQTYHATSKHINVKDNTFISIELPKHASCDSSYSSSANDGGIHKKKLQTAPGRDGAWIHESGRLSRGFCRTMVSGKPRTILHHSIAIQVLLGDISNDVINECPLRVELSSPMPLCPCRRVLYAVRT